MDLFSLSQLAGIWHQVEHIGALTGLSLGALFGCAIALYFGWKLFIVRLAVALVATAAISACAAGLYEHSVGRSEVLAEWGTANAKAVADRAAQTKTIAASTKAKFDPIAELLIKQAAGRNTMVTEYERKIPAAAAAACPLGDAAVKLRPVVPKRR